MSEWTARFPRRPGTRSLRPPVPWGLRPAVLSLVALALLSAGCAEYKKLSAGGSIAEVLVYDVMGKDREPDYYYNLVRTSHRESDFCYECGKDPFLVDKNIDAVQKLGNASFGRLEGQAEVVELFADVLLEDRSSLARASAAGSLTKIGLRLPPYPVRAVPDRGEALLSVGRELDALHDPAGKRLQDTPATRQRVADLVTRLGDLSFDDYPTTKNAIKPFYSRPYLVDERDPALRAAIDTALVKRMDALVRHALRAGVEDPAAVVRVDAIQGLRLLADRPSVEGVIARLEVEADWLVRMEAVAFLGRMGTREGVVALVGRLEDPNASVRHAVRQALTRLAGADYGFRRSSWIAWARSVDPSIDIEEGDEEKEGGKDEEAARPVP